ncbi:MAG: hypothetical protein A3A86_05375 [Elusimicrobia bacterium RIFCSPLOWO2_01_FULL_60_11]|nr:MAG: hypothetical protein A3A86_05375 [Elusimicrobia bacterium RIFCSPLOWO2_01_FULL_60_11]
MLGSSLARRLILGVIPVSLSAICVLGTSAYWISKKHIVGNINKEIATLGSQAGTALSDFFKQRIHDLETTAETPLLADYYNNLDFGLNQEAETYRKEIERYFSRFSQRTGVYDRIIYRDEKGNEVFKIVSSRISTERENPKGRILRPGTGDPYRYSLQNDPAFGPIIVYEKPLFNPSGAFRGILVFECSLSPVTDILNRLNVGSSGWAYITDKDGKIILGKPAAPSKRPQDHLVTQAPISETQWNVTLGTNASDFLNPLNQIRDLTLWIGGLCGLLVVLFVVFRVRSVTHPIKELVRAAQGLQAGDLSARVTVQSQDEIGTLSKAFNTMAGSLEERTRDLEARVRENTGLLQNLSESEARFRSVLENSPVAILGLSREHRIATWNRGAEQIFGYSRDFILGKPLPVLFPPDREADFKKLMSEVMLQGSVRDYPIQGVTKSGRKLSLDLSWGGSFQDFWMNKEWTIVIRDVTEAKKLEAQIIRSEKLSAVGQLLSSIAHELNNPLQAVIGYAQLLSLSHLTGGKGEKKHRFPSEERDRTDEELKMIVDNSLRCRKIIDNLLLFVRHGELEKRPVRIQKAIEAALDLLQYKLSKSANIAVHSKIPSNIPLVQGDFQQIQQVFVNLVNNACDAMTGWPGPKEMNIRVYRSRNRVRAELADSGPGIPREVQAKLFEPFFTTKPEGRGTGLGLSVCRQIMQDHGGAIGFRSMAGAGTTFWIELPIAKGKERVPETPKMSLPQVQGKNILLIDDEPDILAYLSKVVRMDGHLAEAASSLEEAKMKIVKRPYDLIVADVRLGEGTGIDLYENWTQWSKHPRPEFLLVTGDVLNAGLEQVIEDKTLILLHKPVDLEDFLNAVRSLLTPAA